MWKFSNIVTFLTLLMWRTREKQIAQKCLHVILLSYLHVTLTCNTRTLYPHVITTRYTRPLYPHVVPARYTHTSYPHVIPTRHTHTLYPHVIPPRYTHTLYPHVLTTRYTYTLYPHVIPTRHTHTLYPHVIPTRHARTGGYYRSENLIIKMSDTYDNTQHVPSKTPLLNLLLSSCKKCKIILRKESRRDIIV